MESTAQRTGWYKAKEILRIAYTIPFVMASVIGVAFALTTSSEWTVAALIPVDVFLLALFVNFSNDYFDHRSGVDKLRFADQFNPKFQAEIAELFNQKIYWSGNSLDRGLITDRQGRMLMAALALAAVIVSLPIVMYAGLVAVVLGLIGLALAFFYTAPPVNLGARGFGEVDVFLSFSMISFFSYFVLAQQFSWTMLFLSLAVGTAVMMMRISDEAPAYETHLRMGEKNLLVRFGRERMVRMMAALTVAFYGLVAMAALTEPVFALLFLTVPIPVGAIRLIQRYDDQLKYWRPIPQFLKLAVASELLIIIALIARTAWTSW